MPPPPPPTSRAEPMGPPPLPPSTSQPLAASAMDAKEQKNYMEKYYKLKRLYWDLQEKYKNLVEELHSSGMRNSALIQERSVLLDRIIELESPPAHKHSHSPGQLPASAIPRSLYSERSQAIMRETVKQAMEESAVEDRSVDPALASRHIGPAARKREREEAEARAQQIIRTEDQPTAAKRRRTKKDKEVPEPVAAPPPPAPKRIRAKQPVEPSAPPVIQEPPIERQPVLPPSAQQPQQQHLLNDHRPIPHVHQDKSDSPLHSSVSSPRGEELPPVVSSSPRYQARTPSASSAVSNAPPPPSSALSSQSYPSPEVQPTSPTDSFRSPEMYTANGRHARPKRLKAHTVAHKTHQIPNVPRDPHGAPVLPLNVGIMTVISLGTVCLREHFHTERYIFPIGYEVTRRYLSARDPHSEVVYHCKILNGETGPNFQIIADDQPEKPIVAGTPTGAWSVVVRAANHIRNRAHSNSVSGPDFFGLGQNTIKHLIQQLPDADRLKDYVWQTFVEGGDGRPLGGRHAAVAPALTELASASPYEGGGSVVQVYDAPMGDVEMESEHPPGRRRNGSQSSQSTQSPISPYPLPPAQPVYAARPQREEPPYRARSPQQRESERYPLLPGRESGRYQPPLGRESEACAPPPHATYAYSDTRGSHESYARSQPESYTRSPPDSYTTQSRESYTRSPPSSTTTSFARGESYWRSPPPREAAVPAGMAGLMNAYDGPPRYVSGHAQSDERDRDRSGSRSSGGAAER
ncbi:hypothetical protein PENSPDRAFT_649101 [Peniophora sp. CONT]|nr:hypothetical protein PENSPDRAFT_649101 [Peniophora sp. CONT]